MAGMLVPQFPTHATDKLMSNQWISRAAAAFLLVYPTCYAQPPAGFGRGMGAQPQPKLVEVAGKIFDFTGRLAATSSGKYVPTTLDEHLNYMRTFLDDPASAEASALLRGLPLPPPPKVEVTVMAPAAKVRERETSGGPDREDEREPDRAQAPEPEPSPSTDDEEERASI